MKSWRVGKELRLVSPTQTCLCTHHQGFILRGGRYLGYVAGTARGDRFFIEKKKQKKKKTKSGHVVATEPTIGKERDY